MLLCVLHGAPEPHNRYIYIEGNQKTTGKQGKYGRPGGGDYTRLWPMSGLFDVGRSDGLRTDVDKVMPRWGGHVLSWPPDSGIGLTLDGRTQGSGVGRFDQSTFRQSISQPPRWKRRADGRMLSYGIKKRFESYIEGITFSGGLPPYVLNRLVGPIIV